MIPKTAVITLCVGKDRIEDTERLIDTFTKYSDYDILVVSDCIENLPDRPDVKYIELKSITELPTFMGRQGETFNYNLKGIVIKYCYEKFLNYSKLIWADCDVFLTRKNEYLDTLNSADIYGRSGLISHNPDFTKKFNQLKVILNFDFVDAPTMNECVIIFNRSLALDKYMRDWARVIEASYENGLKPYFELVEIAIALEMNPDVTYIGLNHNEEIRTDTSILTKFRNSDLPVF